MTKQDLQKELKEKVKPGVKPSHLRKLKRSKSADDIPSAPPLPNSVPVSRSKSTEPFEELVTLRQESKNKSATISLLRKKIDELEKTNPPTQLLQDQLKEKQTEIETLRQQLETKPALTELDDALFARHKNLKDWFTQYSKNKALDAELQENIDEASTELITQDQTISQLRGEVRSLQKEKESLQKDLNLATKLAEMRKNPLPNNNPDYSNLVVYAFLAFWFISLLTNSWNNFKDNER